MKEIELLVNKIHLPLEMAEWVVSLTDKHHVWVANEILVNMNRFLVSKSDFELIIKWKKEDNEYNLKNLKFHQAIILAEEHFSKNIKFKKSKKSLNNKRVYLDLGRYKWVKIRNAKDCKEEGKAMKHCLKDSFFESVESKRMKVFSLRDKYNIPHVTLDMHVNLIYGKHNIWTIKNLFGKANSVVSDKYIKCVVEFLENNDYWKQIEIIHKIENVAQTMMKVIVYSIENEKYDLIIKIINSLDDDLKWVMRNYVGDCFNVKSGKLERKISKKLGLLWTYEQDPYGECDESFIFDSSTKKAIEDIINKKPGFFKRFFNRINEFKDW